MPNVPANLPVLPIRNAVIFPGATMPLVVGRPRSLRAIEAASLSSLSSPSTPRDGLILVVTQKVISASDPVPNDLYQVGVVSKIDSAVNTDTGTQQLVITGISRYRVEEYKDFKLNSTDTGYLYAVGESVADVLGNDPVRSQALFNSLKDIAGDLLDLLPGAGEALSRLVDRLDDPTYLTNICAAYLNISTEQKQQLLEETSVDVRMERLLEIMQKEREVLNLQRDIHEKMSERLTKAQREALLREQLHTIREELGEEGSEVSGDVSQKLKNAQLPDDVQKVASDELKRLEQLPSVSAEYHVIRTYLDWLADMPWKKATRDNLNLEEARKILDEDHYGLEQVKKRILQYLAVAKLKNDLHGPILCLIGPPGVGKTSLGQSIARALGRKFVRTSLGGVRDEAEIRGHRRTYIGAMPGRIIQQIKRIAVNNPLFMLDEIDKLGISFQGDPASAMLEVLDPEQNKSFVDHYLDVPFDLSNVFFIATANVADTIPPALLDRMEILELTGYTTIEKLHIARKHLLPKLLRDHGLRESDVSFPDDAILKIINSYTREAGVRELSREIASVLRGCAENLATGSSAPIAIDLQRISETLGPEKFHPEVAERAMRPGVATGLAWTPQGGDILFIEAAMMPGTGKVTLTGSLGDVMKESAHLAVSFARSELFPSQTQVAFDKNDFHIHVPSGAIPKDGPSAGVTILSAICSLVTGRTIDPKLAMTGEITLRGAVLPVGGIKEKVLAAHRAGVAHVLIPARNSPDLRDVPEDVRSKLDIKLISTIEEALKEALGLRISALQGNRGQPQREQTPTTPTAA
jgi:ATP-dependent Lon protease